MKANTVTKEVLSLVIQMKIHGVDQKNYKLFYPKDKTYHA